MYNLHEITAKIMNTPPYQLPPIFHHGGVYQLDVDYRGKKLHKVSHGLEDCMLAYFDFVVRVNDDRRYGAADFQRMTAPVGLGKRMRTVYPTNRPVSVVDEKGGTDG